MAGLFPAANSYDDQNNLMVNSSNQFMKATVTMTLVGASASGIVRHMYDEDTATICYLTWNTSNNGQNGGMAKWKFEGKPKFKNVFVVYYADASGATSNFFLDGSNDDSTWTQLGTTSVSTAGGYASLTVASVNYAYLRARATQTSTGGIAGVADIMGTI